MPVEEPRGFVDGIVRLAQGSEEALEDVRAFGGNLQRHLDIVAACARGQPDGVVQEHLMGADLDQQRGRPASLAKTGDASGADWSRLA